MTRAFLVAATLAASACTPHLYAMSSAPPGTVATLDSDHDTVELTQGAALAFRCGDLPCKRAMATSEDPAIADVRPAALARLEYAGFAGYRQTAAFVLVGKAPGQTRVRVTSKDGDRTLRVTVLPPP